VVDYFYRQSDTRYFDFSASNITRNGHQYTITASACC